MTWSEVCADPSLQNLPYKIELNEFGQIVMSPASNDHGWSQMNIGIMLSRLISNGELFSECSIDTRLGVKVADVAWLSNDFVAQYGRLTPYPAAPEICVEVISPSNSKIEMAMKRSLYFEQGAKEVWFCDADHRMKFYSPEGEIGRSMIVPEFPEIL